MLSIRLKKLFCILTNVRLLISFLRYRVAPSVEHKQILSNEFNTIVDIGANRGQFAKAAQIYSSARVISFEPLPDAAATCMKLCSSQKDFVIFEAAIAPNSSKRLINVSKSDDSSSLLEIGTKQVEIFPGTEKLHSIEIKSGPLSSFINQNDILKPALLKIDVQGFELQALQGCADLLQSFDQVYCECSFLELYENQCLSHEVISFLRQRGFVLIGVYNTSYTKNGVAIQADFLFEKKSDIN